MLADLLTLTGVVPLDRRGQNDNGPQAPFKKPAMGMYYGFEPQKAAS